MTDKQKKLSRAAHNLIAYFKRYPGGCRIGVRKKLQEELEDAGLSLNNDQVRFEPRNYYPLDTEAWQERVKELEKAGMIVWKNV